MEENPHNLVDAFVDENGEVLEIITQDGDNTLEQLKNNQHGEDSTEELKNNNQYYYVNEYERMSNAIPSSIIQIK